MNFTEFYFFEGNDIMTDEMKKHFENRTNKHIGLVQKYCEKINNLKTKGLEDIILRGEIHDASKFEEPEYTPYVYLTWNYKCKADGIDSGFSDDIQQKMNVATNHHVKSNKHHPESFTDEVDVINRDDRDKPPSEMVDATGMKEIDLAEMCADWCAMSEELGGSPIEWANKNINIRWKFTDNQCKFILDLVNKIWENENEKLSEVFKRQTYE